MESNNINLDHRIIYSIVEPDSHVLDLGCGKGELLYPLVRDKHVQAQGIELNDKAIQHLIHNYTYESGVRAVRISRSRW